MRSKKKDVPNMKIIKLSLTDKYLENSPRLLLFLFLFLFTVFIFDNEDLQLLICLSIHGQRSMSWKCSRFRHVLD